MTIRRRLPLAALLAVAALAGAGAGCGGSDEPSADDAQAAYSSVRAQITGLGGSIAAAIDSASRSTDAQLGRAFEQLQQRGDAAVARIDDLSVPDDLDDERAALRDAVEKGTGDLADIASAAKDSDADAARAAAEQLIVDSQAIRTARDAFEQALDEATK